VYPAGGRTRRPYSWWSRRYRPLRVPSCVPWPRRQRNHRRV